MFLYLSAILFTRGVSGRHPRAGRIPWTDTPRQTPPPGRHHLQADTHPLGRHHPHPPVDIPQLADTPLGRHPHGQTPPRHPHGQTPPIPPPHPRQQMATAGGRLHLFLLVRKTYRSHRNSSPQSQTMLTEFLHNG